METFNTQFDMSGARTDVTVRVLNNNTFACTLNLVDFFDGGELIPDENDCDATLKVNNGKWEIVGKSKITLNNEDLQNLGNAIDQDYLKKLE